MKKIGCLLIGLFLIGNSIIAQQRKNAIRTDPVLGLIVGNATLGYERAITDKFAVILTGHHIRVENTRFQSIPDGSYLNDQYSNKGIRGTLSLRFYSDSRLGKFAKRQNFIEPTFFTGQHTMNYQNKLSSGLGTAFPFTEDYFSEVGKIETQVISSGLGLNIGRKWKSRNGEFLEFLVGTGYRYTSDARLPITYIKFDRSTRQDDFKLRNDVNGLFLKASIIFGLSF